MDFEGCSFVNTKHGGQSRGLLRSLTLNIFFSPQYLGDDTMLPAWCIRAPSVAGVGGKEGKGKGRGEKGG